MDLKSLQKGSPGSFVSLPGPALFSGLIGSPIGVVGRFTWLLHVVRRGLCPHDVRAVIQLLPLKDDLVAPPPRLYPLCIVVKVLEAVPMHLLVEVVQEGRVPQRIFILEEVPPASVRCSMCLVMGAVRALASSAVTSRVTEI